jgi:hypothetical protein
MIYGDFSSIPLILVINRKTCFLYFYVSGTFPNSNWPEIFQALIFYRDNLNEMGHEYQMSTSSMGPYPNRAT